MSADNYIVIRKLETDWNWYWGMGFLSDFPVHELPDASIKHGPYDTLTEALQACEGEYVEYGVHVDWGFRVEIDWDTLDQMHSILGQWLSERDSWKDEPRFRYKYRWDDAAKMYMRVGRLLGDEAGQKAVEWVKSLREGK